MWFLTGPEKDILDILEDLVSHVQQKKQVK